MKYFCYCFFVLSIFINVALAKSNELKVAIFIEPPYAYLSDNELKGEHIDIIKFLAKSIELPLTFLPCPFIRCLTMVKQGQADMMLGLSKSSVREKDLIFIEPPHLVQHRPLRFFTLKEKKLTIKHFNDLKPLLVGTLRGSAYFPLFDNNQEIEKVELTSSEQLVRMLLKGRIDTLLDREEAVLPFLSAEEYQNKLTMADYQFNKPINSYLALSKNSDTKIHAKKLSQILAKAMADGTIKQIQERNQKILAEKSSIQ